MSPQVIAETAWDQRHDRMPLDTIMEAMGLEDIPSARRDGFEVVHRWNEALNAWKELVTERTGGDLTLALPGRLLEDLDRVAIDCEVCGDTVLVKPSEAERRRYCSQECSQTAQRGRSPKEGRNHEMVRLVVVERESKADVAHRFGVSEETVRRVVKEWQTNSGWAMRRAA